jgi:hypothetical protein
LLYIYFAFIVAYFTLYFCGYFLKVLLLNDDLKKYDLYITPWLGTGVIILVFFPLSWLGFSVRSAVNYFILGVIVCDAAVYLKFREGARFGRKDVITAAVTGFIVATVYGGILAAHDFSYYNISSNTDFTSYLNVARTALISSANFIRRNHEGIPHWYITDLSLNSDFRGCVYVYAFFSALCNQSLLRVMYIISAFVMFLNIMTFRLFLKGARYTFVLCVLFCLLAFNSFFQKLVFWVFLGQLFSVGFVMTAFFIGFYLSERKRFDLRSCLLLVFTLTANSLNYVEALAYPIVPLVAFGLMCLLHKSEGWKVYWKNMLLSGTLFAVLNFIPIYNFFGLFLRFNKQFPGWAMHMVTLMDVAGMHGAFDSPGLPFVAVLLGANAVIAGMILDQMRREGYTSFLSVSCVSYILLYIAFCAMFFRIGNSSSYNAFKGALSMSFILVIIMLRFFEHGLNVVASWSRGLLTRKDGKTPPRFPPFRESAAAVFFTLFFFMNAVGTANLLRFYYMNPQGSLNADGDAIEMYAENGEYADSDFIINADTPVYHLGAVYHAPWGRTYTASYSGIDEGAERVMKGFIRPGDIYVTVPEAEDVFNTSDAAMLFENASYRISRFGSSSLLVSDYGGLSNRFDLANTPSGTKLVRRLKGDMVGYEIMSLVERRIDITVTFFDPAMAAFEIVAFVNGEEFKAEYAALNHFIEARLRDISLVKGMNYLYFEISGDTSMMSIAAFDLITK